MPTFINHNGKITRDGLPVIKTSDWGYRYGCALFETMKIKNGEIAFADLHFERLFRGFDILKFQVPEFFLAEKLSAEVLDLCRLNQCGQLARARLSVSRGDEEELNYVIESSPLKIHEESLTVGIFPDAKKSCDVFSNLKSANRLPYVMAEKFAKKNQLDDCLVLNAHERVCDSTIANVFWIKDGEIFTPPLSEGCVDGVMRKWLMGQLIAARYPLHEKICPIEELQHADEIFLTNAVRGIRSVKRYSERELSDRFTIRLKQQFVID